MSERDKEENSNKIEFETIFIEELEDYCKEFTSIIRASYIEDIRSSDDSNEIVTFDLIEC